MKLEKLPIVDKMVLAAFVVCFCTFLLLIVSSMICQGKCNSGISGLYLNLHTYQCFCEDPKDAGPK